MNHFLVEVPKDQGVYFLACSQSAAVVNRSDDMKV